jgi:hypothetical protein
MRYLVLLFAAALMILNEPIKSATDGDHVTVGGQDVSSVAAPATAPAALDVLSSSSTVATSLNAPACCIQPSATTAISERSQRDGYNYAPTDATNFDQLPAVASTQEGSRLLCFTSLTSTDNLNQLLPSDMALLPTSSRSREAVPRRTT